MPTIQEILNRAQGYKEPKGGDWLNELRFTKEGGDIVYAHFLDDPGNSGQFFEVFQAHAEKNLRGYEDTTYCPVQTGHDPAYPCAKCTAGIKVKKRMLIWFYIYDILKLNAKAPEPGQPPMETTVWNGRTYYVEHVNAFKYWEASAWKDSCLTDINFMLSQYGDLRARMVNISASGMMTDRRYKIFPLHESTPTPAEIQTKAQVECKPVIDMLREQLTVVPVVANPAGPYAPPVAATAPYQAPMTAYTPPGGAPAAPAYQPPFANGAVLPSAQPLPTPTPTPMPTAMPTGATPTMVASAPTPTAEEQPEDLPFETPASGTPPAVQPTNPPSAQPEAPTPPVRSLF